MITNVRIRKLVLILGAGSLLLAADGDPRFLECDNALLQSAAATMNRLDGAYFLIKDHQLVDVIPWHARAEALRRDSGRCAVFGDTWQHWTPEQREAIGKASIVAVQQLEDLDHCAVLEITGRQALQGVKGQCGINRRIRCVELRQLLAPMGYDRSNIETVITALSARPLGVDAGSSEEGVSAPSDAGESSQ